MVFARLKIGYMDPCQNFEGFLIKKKLWIPFTENALCVFEENFHPLSMIFNENEVWIPNEGNDVILTSPPVLKILKAKTEYLDEDEGMMVR